MVLTKNEKEKAGRYDVHPSNDSRRNSRGGGKGRIKGWGPKGITPSGKSIQLVFYKCKMGQCPKRSACDYWRPPACSHDKPKSWCKCRRSAHFCTQAKPVTTKIKAVAMQLLPCSWRMHKPCVVFIWPNKQGWSKKSWWSFNKEWMQSSILTKCGETLPYNGKQNTFVCFYPVESPKWSQSKRPDLWTVWRRVTNSSMEIAQTYLQDPRDVSRKIGLRSSNMKLIQDPSFGQESDMKNDNLWLTQEGPYIWWARATLPMKSKKLYGNPYNVGQLLPAIVYVTKLAKFLTVQLLEDSLAVLSVVTICEGHQYSSELYQQSYLELLSTQVSQTMQKQHREAQRRKLRETRCMKLLTDCKRNTRRNGSDTQFLEHLSERHFSTSYYEPRKLHVSLQESFPIPLNYLYVVQQMRHWFWTD